MHIFSIGDFVPERCATNSKKKGGRFWEPADPKLHRGFQG